MSILLLEPANHLSKAQHGMVAWWSGVTLDSFINLLISSWQLKSEVEFMRYREWKTILILALKCFLDQGSIHIMDMTEQPRQEMKMDEKHTGF